MDDGLKQAKSTGYTPSIRAGKGSGSRQRISAPVDSVSAAQPVFQTAPTKAASPTTGGIPAEKLLALSVMMGDFKELKSQLPYSWQSSGNGKIYWCAEFPGHKLTLIEGKLLVDGIPLNNLLDKLLVESEKK